MLSLFFSLLLLVRCISFWWCTFPRFFPFLFPLKAVKHCLNFIQDYKRYFCLSSLTCSLSLKVKHWQSSIDSWRKKKLYSWEKKSLTVRLQSSIPFDIDKEFYSYLSSHLWSRDWVRVTLCFLLSYSTQIILESVFSSWKCIERVNVCRRSRNDCQIKKILDDFCLLLGRIMMRLLKYA